MALIETSIHITQPSKIVASENAIVFILGTATGGSDKYRKTRFHFTAVTSNNYKATVLFYYPSIYSTTFTARDYPNKDSYLYTSTIKNQFGDVINTGITHTQRAGTFAESLQKDVFISTKFYIDTSGNTVDLVSTQPGSRFAVSLFLDKLRTPAR